MEKRKKSESTTGGAHETELDKELERLVNENKALMKVLKKVTPEKETRKASSVRENNSQNKK